MNYIVRTPEISSATMAMGTYFPMSSVYTRLRPVLIARSLGDSGVPGSQAVGATFAAPPSMPDPAHYPQPTGRSVFVEEAAELLGVSRRTVYYRIRDGKLQTVRTRGGSRRVLLESIGAMLRESLSKRRARLTN